MNASNDQNQPTEKTVEQINEHSSSNLVNFGSSLKILYNNKPKMYSLLLPGSLCFWNSHLINVHEANDLFPWGGKLRTLKVSLGWIQ